MKRKLLVTVDCGVKTCGKCPYCDNFLAPDICNIFDVVVPDGKRCPECLKAEAK